MLLRVRLAFAQYPVGYVFQSPPLPGTLRQEWLNRGFLEVVKSPTEAATSAVPKPQPAAKGKRG
jgi:hypothetical protein